MSPAKSRCDTECANGMGKNRSRTRPRAWRRRPDRSRTRIKRSDRVRLRGWRCRDVGRYRPIIGFHEEENRRRASVPTLHSRVPATALGSFLVCKGMAQNALVRAGFQPTELVLDLQLAPLDFRDFLIAHTKFHRFGTKFFLTLPVFLLQTVDKQAALSRIFLPRLPSFPLLERYRLHLASLHLI